MSLISDRRERTALAAMACVVFLLNLVGWGVLLGLVVPQQYDLGSSGVFGVGLGVTAFLLGVRHAFDADHIAAIDNTARKLVGDGKSANGVGFWFSLGHSSVVFGLSLLLAIGVGALAGPIQDENSTLQTTLGLVGSLVAGTFLIVIGLTNLSALFGIIHVFRHMRAGSFDEEKLEHHLHQRGFMARLFRRATQRVTKARHLYPVGLLMGLGFDTATQVALLILAGGVATSTLPWYAVLVLPVLFAAGMTPVRHRRWNLHGARVQVGTDQSAPQGLLQPDHHHAVGRRRTGNRRRCAAATVSRAVAARRLRVGDATRPAVRRLPPSRDLRRRVGDQLRCLEDGTARTAA